MKPGFCECGCGQKTNIARQSSTKHGYIRGKPMRFVRGHATRGRRLDSIRGAGNGRWTGGRRVHENGYIIVSGGINRDGRREVREHILIAEKALGRRLPPGAEVHHVNGDRADNRPENLVVCQDRAYHQLLHRRQRALEACGNANWMLCYICGRYDDPANMYLYPHERRALHRACNAAHQQELRARRAA